VSSQNAFHVEGKTLSSVQHAAGPTHGGAEAKTTLPTRSCAPSHFITLADKSPPVFELAFYMLAVAVCFSDC
jgi:hypothetical protein